MEEAAVTVTAPLRAERLVLRHAGADTDALRDVSLHVARGEILTLVGPNGAGKSSLMAALAAELRARAGGVWLDDFALAALSPRRRALRLARLPQSPQSSEGIRVGELAMLGRYARLGPLRAPTPADIAAVAAALDALDLLRLRERSLETLSGGERRRAWLAMVLAQDAPVLLLDEPSAGLDLRHQWELLERLRVLARQRGLAVVVALHDLEQAAAIASRVAVLQRGRLYCVAPPERAIDAEMLRDVFRVEARVERDADALRIRVLGPAEPVRTL
jgi:iron complex transport system ATP-binding protein